MSSIDEYSAQIGAAIQAVEQAQSTVGQSKSGGEDLASQLESMGAEATGATIRSSVDQGGEAESLLVEAINKLKEMQSTAESARGSGLRGGGGDTSEAQNPHSNGVPSAESEPMAGPEAVIEDDDLRRKGENLADFFTRKGGDVSDVAETVGKQIDIAWESVGVDPTPETGLVSSTETANRPTFQAQPADQPRGGSLLVAGFAITAVVTKGVRKASAAIRNTPKVGDK
ncbi:MAG TPA: hypothetical protein VE172_09730 [Stackebrandtia sp.]|uniref:hypothetical protein n=1 Tax=Stackebrandtia sp. TaxID=2023065 RepID=UPI002D23C2A9|nr:hypothetical protein [Stackebrandtia sp.]HZE39076.1 hypothetical protein [Stackebrandtia sp.]